MGIGTFIVAVEDPAQVNAVLKAITSHNKASPDYLGERPESEIQDVNPRLYATLATLRSSFGAIKTSLSHRHVRGEDILPKGAIVRFQDKVWIEFANSGAAACSTEYFEREFAELGIIGSRGKPEGWGKTSSMVDTFDTMAQLRRRALALVQG